MTDAPTTQPQARPVAVIDIGSNSVRMIVAQVTADGACEVLERTTRPVRLGQDTFVEGRLKQRTMNAAVAILRDSREILDTYRVQQVRAVATSAVREAANADAFLDRVLMATSLDVEIIDPSEESRLIVSAVRGAVGHALGGQRGRVLVAEVGGGSMLLTVLHRGEIAYSGSYGLGAIRLQETLAIGNEPPRRAAEMLRHQVAGVLLNIRASLRLEKVRRFIAVGGDARFAARLIGRTDSTGRLAAIGAEEFDLLVDTCAEHTPEELARAHRLPFADAETLVPALVTYQALLHASGADEILVPQVSMRDGLLEDMARSVSGREDARLAEGVVQSARSIGEKFQIDAPHAEGVSELAARLFDELQREHRLGPRHRLLLRVGGLLHEVGNFISSRAHHKHSHYLIANSEIFGLRREERMVVALLGRYHRRSTPKPTHVEYMSLPREPRMVVSKLAAILRVADALDRGHGQQVRDIRVERRGGDLVITAHGVSDLALERRALAAKGDLMQEIYGLSVRLEEGPAVASKP